MKKVLLTLLALVLLVGALGAVGMTGYRFGYAQGVAAGSDGETLEMPRGFGLGPQRMPMHNFGFDRGFDREFGPGGFHMMRRGGMGIGFFGPLVFLFQIAFWGLLIWAIYTLVLRSGWRLTRTTPITQTTSTSAPADTTPETKE